MFNIYVIIENNFKPNVTFDTYKADMLHICVMKIGYYSPVFYCLAYVGWSMDVARLHKSVLPFIDHLPAINGLHKSMNVSNNEISNYLEN